MSQEALHPNDTAKSISRRTFVETAAACIPILGANPASAGSKPTFPKTFLWGAATAGHQVEGNNTNSDIWLLEHVKPTLFKEPSGDACDSLHRWEEDLDLVKSLHLNCYRFSIEWSRVEPEKAQFSHAYLDFYKRMADGCRMRELTPVATFSHFTSPRWFAAQGGWENPDAPVLFARYCEKVTRHLGDRIAYAVTFNEPNLRVDGAWSPTPVSSEAIHLTQAMFAAAAKACDSDRFSIQIFGNRTVALPNMLQGHRIARQAIKAIQSKLPVGLSLALPDDQAVGAHSQLEQKRRDSYGPFLELAKADDFIGVQTYSRALIGAKGALPVPARAERTQMGDEFYPEAIQGSVAFAHKATGRPVLITENGIATEDDSQRVRFIAASIDSVGNAVRQGIPVLGYIHWSLLDNFEWILGYRPKFGLVAVDRRTFARTPKPSAQVLADIVRRHTSG
jgi:beta-glucosidase